MAYRPIDFNIIQTEFEQRFPDGKLFEGKNFNYIKLVQHGLSYAMTGADDKLLKKNPFGSWWMFKLKSHIHARRNKRLNFLPQQSEGILFLEGRRRLKLPAGEEISPITHLIRETVLSTEYSWWDTTGAFEKEADFSVRNLSGWYPPANEIQHEIYLELKGVLRKIKEANVFSEIEFQYVESAFYVFFNSFRRWHALLSVARPKTLVGITHYHNEGCLAAAQLLGIKTIELQHGLISKHDLYYVYPNKYREALSKGIFPNEIWLFGNFWKEVLQKGAESEFMKPLVIGNFTTDVLVKSELLSKENRLLLCAQKNLSQPYIDWIRFMKKQILPLHPDWKLIVKLHPLESQVEKYSAEANDLVEVLPISASLNEELKRAKIQVSIYSTTFFDAIGMSVKNYALDDIGYSLDYSSEMVAMGVAESLKKGEDVIEKFESSSIFSERLTREDVFAPFQPRLMQL
ncbi:MAG: hypothetical protein NWQ44_07925 [Flavobacteriales bacterium]|jgi:hypothetical protein|nr:hypothetical protein [Flavobacteriales bacterium]MDP4716825.1 hypothetical protein [Flavobacteriales bacterium]MDP4731738.1 hypothetical protein [Flavobacteriales bacterium]MDP4819337.1 hypothetical protein [Flavobacteriales bacterium]MDP4951642.1 hypothetical protein [Flavobacteriales bacterium]